MAADVSKLLEGKKIALWQKISEHYHLNSWVYGNILCFFASTGFFILIMII